MKIVQVFQPQRGSIRKITLREKLTLSLNFDISGVETMQEGNDLLFVFPDGSIVLLEEFYSTKHPPMFLLANGEIVQSFEDIMASADANLPQIDTSTEGLTTASQDVLSLPVAAGASIISNGGLGEYRDGIGNVVGGIDRLGPGSGISIGGNSAIDSFLSDQVEPSQMPSNSSSQIPPQTLGSMETWKDIVIATNGAGLQNSVPLFPNVSLGTSTNYSSIKLQFGEGWGPNSNDNISINDATLDPLPSSITIGSLTLKLEWNNRDLVITSSDGSALTQAQVNTVLSSFNYLNSNMGNIAGMFDLSNTGDGPIKFDFLKTLQTGFKGLNVTLTPSTGTEESFTTNVEFRQLLNLGNSSVNTVVGVGTSATQNGGSASLSTGKDWAIIGSNSADTISVSGEGSGRYHFIVGGGGDDSIHAVSNDHYLVVGNGTYDSVNGIVNALDTTSTGTNVITTGSGNDTIIGGTGNDTINAGLGYNWILTGGSDTSKGATEVILDGNAGSTNTIVMTGATSEESLSIKGSINNDTILSQHQTANTAKNDKVTISGNVQGGVVSLGSGNDEVLVSQSVSAGVIDMGTGDDTITIKGSFTNGQILTGDGKDSVSIEGTMSGGLLDIGEGNDQVTISVALAGGTITASGGDNQIIIGSSTASGSMSGGSIQLTGGKDSITIYGDMSGGSITTQDGEDQISITGTMSGNASIHTGAWKDTVEVGALAGGIINTALGDDVIYSKGTMSGGTINSGDGDDTITIGGDLTGGTIDGGTGNDKITVVGNVGTEGTGGCGTGTGTGVILGGEGDDEISIGGNLYAGTINGGAGSDKITIAGSMQGGVIEATEGSNEIILSKDMSCGTINLGGDSNTLVIGSTDFTHDSSLKVDSNTTVMAGGSIDASQGKNVIQLHGDMTGGNITLGAGVNTVDTTVKALEIHGSVGTKDTNSTVKAMIISQGANNIDIAGRVQHGASIVLNGDASVGGDVLNIGSHNSSTPGAFDDVMTGGIIDGSQSTANNTIILHKNMTGGTILGGSGADSINIAGSLSNGNIDAGAGNNKISISADVSNSTISSGSGADLIDIQGSLSNGNINSGAGNGAITIKDSVTASTIHSGSGLDFIGIGGVVTNSLIDSGDGNDVILITGTGKNDSVTINAGDGDNTISITGSVSGGNISSGSGADKITIEGTLTNSAINSGAGNDEIFITGSGSNDSITINAGDGDNTISIAGSVSGGNISSGSGVDKITIGGDLTNSTIDAGSGNDSISISGNVSNSTIKGGSGDDTISINSVQSGTLIEGGEGVDHITVSAGMSGGTISAGVGNDLVSISGDLSGGLVSAEDGDDVITVSGNMTGGTVSGGIGNDLIDISGKLSSGDINAGDGIDIIHVSNMSGGTVSGGLGSDLIVIDTISGGNLYGDGKGITDTSGKNTIGIYSIEGTANIYAGCGDSTVSIINMQSGTVYAQGGNNNISVTAMSGGTINLAGESNTLDIGLMSGGTINGSTGRDIVTITTMNGELDNELKGGIVLNLGAGLDRVEIKSLSNATVNMQAGSGKLVATIAGSNVTISTDGTETDINEIQLTLNDTTTTFSGVTINGSKAHDILELSGVGSGKTIKVDDLPSLTDIELVKLSGATLDLTSLTSHMIENKFGVDASFSIEITSWTHVIFGDTSKWTKVEGQDNTYKFEDQGKSLTLTFVGPTNGNATTEITGTPPAINTPTTKPGDVVDNTPQNPVANSSVLDDEKAKNESRTSILESTAAAMALTMGQAVMEDMREESALKGIEETTTTSSSTQPIASLAPTHISTVPGGQDIHDENIIGQEGVGEDNILGGTQDTPEDNIIVLGPEYLVEAPLITPVIEKVVEENIIASEEVEAPIALNNDTLFFEGEVLEGIQEKVQQTAENTSEEEIYPLLPEEAEIKLELVIADLLVEYESTDIPREEVEVTEELYNSVEGDTWYASQVAVTESTQSNPEPYTIDSRQGIQFAGNNEEAPVFTLEEANIIAFELQPPSMEIQYDEQVY
ncbi:MAG: hypothetical protein K2M30_01470 [Desulfovibrionaceae bacterium]|nr:hypothetical protein [Desulfovibrionaceae bacterium]